MKLTNLYYFIAYLTLLLHLLEKALAKSFSIQNKTDTKTLNNTKSIKKHSLKSPKKSNSKMETNDNTEEPESIGTLESLEKELKSSSSNKSNLQEQKNQYKTLIEHDRKHRKKFEEDEKELYATDDIGREEYKKIMQSVTSNSVMKTSQPFLQIIRSILNILSKKEKRKSWREILRIRKLSLEDAANEIIKFSELIKNAKDEKTYWYYFHITAHVILKGRLKQVGDQMFESDLWKVENKKKETNPLVPPPSRKKKDKNILILKNGEDENYDELVKKDNLYKDRLNLFREYTLVKLNEKLKPKNFPIKKKKIIVKKQKTKSSSKKPKQIKKFESGKKAFDRMIKGSTNFREWKGNLDRNKLRLGDFEPNIFLFNKIKKTQFYKYLRKFPKGVIHHLHWSAAFYMGDIMRVMELLIRTNFNKKKITVLIKANIFLEDKTRPNSYFDIPTPKIFIIEDLVKILTKYKSIKFQKSENIFRRNHILADGRCVLDPIANTPKIDEEIKALGFLLFCKNSIMYTDHFNDFPNLIFFKNIKVLDLKELTKFLAKESHILDDFKHLQEDYLPNSYKNLLFNIKDQVSVAVWFKFEMIFGIYSELFKNTQVFKILSDFLKKDLVKDRVIGVEFRQGYDVDKGLKSKVNVLKNLIVDKKNNKTLPVSFILPGRKLKAGHKLRELIKNLDLAKKINDTSAVGFDFFGYEDDPFTGARNFFPLSVGNMINQNLKYSDRIKVKVNNSPNKKEEKETDFLYMLNALRNGKKMYLHAGETLYFPNYPVSRSFFEKFYINDNLIHAALLPNVERVGHGFAVANNELLINIYKKKGISLEICPTSNQALQYYDVEDNPIKKLLRKGLSVTVSPDDPGLFFYSGVRMDWFNLFMSTDLKISEYYLLIRNSILKSSIKEIQENKDKLLKQAKDDIVKFFKSPLFDEIGKKLKKLKSFGNKNLLKISKYQKIAQLDVLNTKKKVLANNLKRNGDKNFKKNNNPYINIYNYGDLIEFSKQATLFNRVKRSKLNK